MPSPTRGEGKGVLPRTTLSGFSQYIVTFSRPDLAESEQVNLFPDGLTLGEPMDQNRAVFFLVAQRDFLRLELIDDVRGMGGKDDLRIPLFSDQFAENLQDILQTSGVDTILRFFDQEHARGLRQIEDRQVC